jgi:hypothetical protein
VFDGEFEREQGDRHGSDGELRRATFGRILTKMLN